jgi:hypothetical protein
MTMHELRIPLLLSLAALATLLWLFRTRKQLPDEKHVFLGLETLSTQPDAAILAIGAVCVDLAGKELGRIKIIVDEEDARSNGAVDVGTEDWWRSQSQEARALTFAPGSPLEDALCEFYAWMKDLGPVDEVWGNGATFDCTILRSAYWQHGGLVVECPWDFWQESDCRTVVRMGERAGLRDYKNTIPFEGVRHNCVDDAAHQARYTTAILRRLS